MHTRIPFLFALLSLIFFTACSDSGIPKYNVSGSITMDGQPLPSGSLTFYPVDGKGPSDGASIKDGKFSAEVTLGSKKVTLVGTRVTGQVPTYEDEPNGPMNDITEEIEFTNAEDVTVTFSESNLTFDYDLKTK